MRGWTHQSRGGNSPSKSREMGIYFKGAEGRGESPVGHAEKHSKGSPLQWAVSSGRSPLSGCETDCRASRAAVGSELSTPGLSHRGTLGKGTAELRPRIRALTPHPPLSSLLKRKSNFPY